MVKTEAAPAALLLVVVEAEAAPAALLQMAKAAGAPPLLAAKAAGAPPLLAAVGRPAGMLPLLVEMGTAGLVLLWVVEAEPAVVEVEGVPLKRDGTDSDINQSHDRLRLLPSGVRM
ncbi:UNVERIFIED_CONTAM: hypothetical protein FKN15_023183 [Acipenser sinensis]